MLEDQVRLEILQDWLNQADIFKNISLIEPILKNLETDLIFQHNPSERTGVIRRITAIRQ